MDKTIKIDIPFFKIMDADSKEEILKAVEEQLVKQLESNVEVVDHISTDLIETVDSLEREEQDGQDLAHPKVIYDYKVVLDSIPRDDMSLINECPGTYLANHALSILINTEDPAVRLGAIKCLIELGISDD